MALLAITTVGMPGDTFTMTSTNNSQALTAGSILGSGGNRCVGVLVTVEDNNVKFCLGGAVPVSSGLGHVLANGQSIFLDSGHAASTLRFISSVAGAHGVLQITPFFELGKT